MIVIPAYNEEKKIGRVLSGLLKQGLSDIVVVDDGSTDYTMQVAQSYSVTVIRHAINRGQGAALQTGHEYALSQKAKYVVDFDSDGQFDPKDIKSALAKLNEGFDIVLGSRFLDSRSVIPFTKKFLLLPVSRFINYLITGIMLTDAHNGFRILSKKALQLIVIKQDQMAHNTEIIEQVAKQGLKYVEVPVKVTYSRYGQGIGGGLNILKDLLIK